MSGTSVKPSRERRRPAALSIETPSPYPPLGRHFAGCWINGISCRGGTVPQRRSVRERAQCMMQEQARVLPLPFRSAGGYAEQVANFLELQAGEETEFHYSGLTRAE